MRRRSRTDQQSRRDEFARTRAERPRELESWLNLRLYHPLAWRLAQRLASTPATPNMVSIAGGLLVAAAGFVYAAPAWPVAALCGLLLHMGWHVVDGADGDLARLTGRSSPTGEMVDGICDYVSHAVLYITLCLAFQAQAGPMIWAVASAAGVSRIIQANHFEVQRRQYQWWAYGAAWLRTSRPDDLGGAPALAGLRRAYLALAAQLAPEAAPIDRGIDAAAGDPARLARLRAAIRASAGDLLPRYQILGADHRTVMLGVAMFAGSPLYYFLYEALALNAALIWSIRRAGQGARRVAARIAEDAA